LLAFRFGERFDFLELFFLAAIAIGSSGKGAPRATQKRSSLGCSVQASSADIYMASQIVLDASSKFMLARKTSCVSRGIVFLARAIGPRLKKTRQDEFGGVG
jgi:hypothetical protein